MSTAFKSEAKKVHCFGDGGLASPRSTKIKGKHQRTQSQNTHVMKNPGLKESRVGEFTTNTTSTQTS